MTKNLSYYCQKFAPKNSSNRIGLNVSRSAGVAPNKPVLLLAVIELIGRRQISANKIYLSAELIATFLKLWSCLEIHRRAEIGLPFFHLKSDGFWHFKAKTSFEFLESPQSKVKVRTISSLRQAVDYAYLDAELYEILQSSIGRAELTGVLIQSWLSDKNIQLTRSLQFNAFDDWQQQMLLTGGKVYQPQEIEQEPEESAIVRDSAFRRIVTSIYEYRCAFCGTQVFHNLDNIVDGAHIKPFAQFYDDRIINGLSLCKNHHWAFDRFWFTIADNYTLIISDTLRENSPHSPSFLDFRNRSLYLPANSQFYPDKDAIAWHRHSFFDSLS